MRMTKINKDIEHFLYEDSKKGSFINPTKWEHLQSWADNYQLTLNEVMDAMIEYVEKHDRKKFKDIIIQTKIIIVSLLAVALLGASLFSEKLQTE